MRPLKLIISSTRIDNNNHHRQPIALPPNYRCSYVLLYTTRSISKYRNVVEKTKISCRNFFTRSLLRLNNKNRERGISDMQLNWIESMDWSNWELLAVYLYSFSLSLSVWKCMDWQTLDQAAVLCVYRANRIEERPVTLNSVQPSTVNARTWPTQTQSQSVKNKTISAAITWSFTRANQPRVYVAGAPL